jgi:phosphatidylserine/phosphatidylglycerophosphate/cardiolipin synthase-like enzyme
MADVDDLRSWFVRNDPALRRFTRNNRVTPLVDGDETFREIVAAMRSVTGSSHYVRMANWYLKHDFRLIPSDPQSTVAAIAQEITARGGHIHAIVWNNVAPARSEDRHLTVLSSVTFLTSLNQHAILDDTVLFPAGSHHQKIMVIYGAEGLVAFCGGIDINPDRLDNSRHCAGTPYHDVHAKIEGPAAADLNVTFIQRWNNHPLRFEDLPHESPTIETGQGSHYVQVTRTYAPRSRYPFAPEGDLGTLNAVRRAIQRARRFIYLEEQYATPCDYPPTTPETIDGFKSADSLGILSDLLDALGRRELQYLLIVIPLAGDQPGGKSHQNRFLAPLMRFYPTKVHVFGLVSDCPEHPSNTPIYVHSKIWIIDDIYAKIGSSNCNRRDFTHDSQADIHVIDGALDNGSRRFAKDLRRQLWAEHLRVSSTSLDDPILALNYWLHPSRTTSRRIRRISFPRETSIDDFLPDAVWDEGVDPDGR